MMHHDGSITIKRHLKKFHTIVYFVLEKPNKAKYSHIIVIPSKIGKISGYDTGIIAQH